jgi:radical SAM superfamily enzyme YgiQ (UPF0313 family)
MMNPAYPVSRDTDRRSSRVLLVSTNRCASPDVVFPLGLCYLDTALRRAGHITRCIDLNIETQPFEQVLKEFRPDVVGLSLRNIDDVLIRKRETFLDGVAALCETARKTCGCAVVLGGSGYSIFPELLLDQTGADYGIQGAGERAFVQLVEALACGEELKGIQGLVVRGRRRACSARAPAFVEGESDQVVERPGWLAAFYLAKTGMLNVQTQRGCPFECCYCTYPLIEGRVRRSREPGVVADEMEAMAGQGAKYVFFTDSVFNSSPQHVRNVCEALIERRLNLRWGCFLRPQHLTAELMELMALAGLAHIEFGSDSFCDTVLEAYQKHLTFDDIRRSSASAKAAGIDYAHYLVCGGPGETSESLEASYELSRSLPGAVIMATVGMRIYPGTALQKRALAEGRISPSNDLLAPEYYLAPGLSEEEVFGLLQKFARQSPNWIPGDPLPGYAQFVERLRRRGVAGPLWSYFSMLQRLWPQAAPA